MPFNGAGAFSRTNGVQSGGSMWQNARDAARKILASDHDTHDEDLATGLSTAICKDGQTTITANLPMAGFRHTNVGNASARTHYASTGQIQDGATLYAGTNSGTTTALIVTTAPAITAYVTGMRLTFKMSASDCGVAPSININSVGNTNLVAADTLATLPAGAIKANSFVEILYTGTAFAVMSVLAPFAATTRLHYPTVGQIQDGAVVFAVTAGTSTAYTATVSPAITAYAAGQKFTLQIHTQSGVAPTININGAGVRNLLLPATGGALPTQYLENGQIVEIVYNGSNFNVLSASALYHVDSAGNFVGAASTVRTFGSVANPMASIFTTALDVSTLTGLSWSAWTPTLGGDASMTFTSTTTFRARKAKIGRTVFFIIGVTGTVGGTPSPFLTFTLPEAAASAGFEGGGCKVLNGTSKSGYWFFSTTSLAHVALSDTSNWVAGTGQYFFYGFYESAA